MTTAHVTSDRMVASEYYPTSVKTIRSHLGKEMFARYSKLPKLDAFANFATIVTFSFVGLFVRLVVLSFARSSVVNLFFHSLIDWSVYSVV